MPLRSLVLLLVLATAAIAQPSSGTADPRCAPLDELMTSFLRDHKLPGAALAVGRNGRLLYARGFGYADLEKQEPVQPDSLFRIASVSKPVTAAAVMKLVEEGKLKLDDHPFELLGITPAGENADPRIARITIRDLLTHAGGWDRGKSGDPMFKSRQIAADLHIPSPPAPLDVTRWMADRPLDFDPGARSAYSNFGYCILGCLIQKATGMPYERHVQESVLKPIGATRMRIGATFESGRAEGEVRYYTSEAAGPSVFDSRPGSLPAPYGRWCLESMDAHGGWIASAPDLVRFAWAVGQPGVLLSKASQDAMWARPAYVDAKAATYYGFGWSVRPVGDSASTWHGGALAGTSTLLVRRHDGFVWAVLFNSIEGKPGGAIDGLIHRAVDQIKEWPEGEPLIAAPATPPASKDR